MLFSIFSVLFFGILPILFFLIWNIVLHWTIFNKKKFSKILNEETFLREFLDKDEKLLWSEKQVTINKKFKMVLLYIGLLILGFLIILVMIEKLIELPALLILSELWLEQILSLIFSVLVIYSLLFIAIYYPSSPISDKVTYYLSNKRLFSSYMLVKSRYIMTFKLSELQYFDIEKLNESSTPIYNFFFKTNYLSDEDINSYILKLSAESDQETPKKYRINLNIDDGWYWKSETNECIIEIKKITDKKGIIGNLKSLEIYQEQLPSDWKNKFPLIKLSVAY